MIMRHFLTTEDWDRPELQALLDTADQLRQDPVIAPARTFIRAGVTYLPRLIPPNLCSGTGGFQGVPLGLIIL